MFRQRICVAALSGNVVRIDKIRVEDQSAPGLHDFEASFLRLIEKLCDGCQVEINETGTTMRFKPGILTGGRIVHDCGTSRSIGWYMEGILPLAIFCKQNVQLTLTGITNDHSDLSVDILKNVTLPLLRNFGIGAANLTVKKRGCYPKGGGEVDIFIPIVRELLPVNITEEGLVARVRGTAFCAKVSPTIVSRVVDSARGVLNKLLPDVYISSDHFRGANSGHSAGYSLSLVAETTTGALLSVERTAGAPIAVLEGGGGEGAEDPSLFGFASEGAGAAQDPPEDVGIQAAHMLLREIQKGGVVDCMHQPLVLVLMAMGPEDVCKVKFGEELTQSAVQTLQILKDAFSCVFKIKREKGPNQQQGEGSIVLSCLGTGYKNMSRRVV